MARRRKRIAILTGGGDCPGLNAVLRAVVKTAQNVHGWDVYGVENGIEGFLVPHGRGVRPLTRDDIGGLLPRGGTVLGSSNRLDIFAVPQKRGAPKDLSHRVPALMKRKGLDCLITVGGDGTARMAMRLSTLGVKVVSVPKTIDNDIRGTDRTFGHDTAVGVVSEAIDRLYTTAESHHRVMLVEVMGRDSGFIALHGGLAGGAEGILIPENPYDPERLADKIRRRTAFGRKFSIIVVAEGAQRAGGTQVYRTSASARGDVSARKRLGGIAAQLAEELRPLTERPVRTVVLGHTQRGGSPSPYDRILATAMGNHAVELVAEGAFGRMVALRGTKMRSVTLASASRGIRKVDPRGQLVQAAREIGITFGAADGSDDAYANARRRHGAP